MELCLIGLLLLSRDKHNILTSVGQAVTVILFILATAVTYYFLRQIFLPLLQHLPVNAQHGLYRAQELTAA